MLAIIILTLSALGILFLGFAKQKSLILPLAILSLSSAIACIFFNVSLWNNWLQDMMTLVDMPKVMILLMFFLAICILPFFKYLQDQNNEELADFAGLFLLSLIGAMMMVTYRHFMILFLGIEILSISMYVMAGGDRKNQISNEASLKYFIMGAFASAILFFGIALFYTSTNTLNLINLSFLPSPIFEISVLIIIAGLSFKIALVPFHFWAPDVYYGTPTVFTSIMATIVKVASFGALYRFLVLTNDFMPSWVIWLLSLIAIASIVLGNIMAISQQHVKKLLTYSGIVQSGFILLGFININSGNDHSLMYYLIAYALASVVCFLIVHFVEVQSGNDHIDSFNGLFRSNPVLGVLMTVSLISLAGIPLTAGFMAKLFILNHAANMGFISLAVISLILAVISMFYYFRLINAIYSKSADQSWQIPVLYRGILILICVAILFVGIQPAFIQSLF
ncbi:MAG: NADH-quinone oxidoreductase subunit N [Bacteroidota bacterium]|nr:NADH-quinone oxidoreductase subunit N [Bacteroidota bacterium]